MAMSKRAFDNFVSFRLIHLAVETVEIAKELDVDIGSKGDG